MESSRIANSSYFSSLTHSLYSHFGKAEKNEKPTWQIWADLKSTTFRNKATEISKDFDQVIQSVLSKYNETTNDAINALTIDLLSVLNTALIFEETLVSKEKKFELPDVLSNFKMKMVDGLLKLLDSSLKFGRIDKEQFQENLFNMLNKFPASYVKCIDDHLLTNREKFSEEMNISIKTFMEKVDEKENEDQPALQQLIHINKWLSRQGKIEKSLRAQNANGDTLIHLAIKRNESPQIIQEILDRVGDGFDIQNKEGNTIYHLIAQNTLYASIILYMFRSTSEDVLSIRNGMGCTTIEYALKIQKDLIPLENGISPLDEIAIDLPDEDHIKLIDILSPASLNTKEGEFTILWTAIEAFRCFEVMEKIIQKGSRSILKGRYEGNTIFHLLSKPSFKNEQSYKAEIFKALLPLDIVTEEVLSLPMTNNWTALDISMEFHKDLELLEMLLNKVNPELVIGPNSRWFHLAALYQPAENLSVLINYFPPHSFRSKNSDGKTPLKIVKYRNLSAKLITEFKFRTDLSVSKIDPSIIEINEDLTSQNFHGDTPIHIAIKNGIEPEIILQMIDKVGKKFNIQNNQGNTIYHLIAQNQFYSSIIVDLFRSVKDELLSLKNTFGWTAIKYALKLQKDFIPLEDGIHPIDDEALALELEDHLDLIDDFSYETLNPDEDDDSILWTAIEGKRDKKVLEKLIEVGGENILKGQFLGSTIFHLLARPEYDPEIFKFFLGLEKTTPELLNLPNKNKITVLESTMQHHTDLELLKMLLKKVLLATGKNSCWYHQAILFQPPENLIHLIKYFPPHSFITKNSNGKTLIEIAAERKLPEEIIKLLLPKLPKGFKIDIRV